MFKELASLVKKTSLHIMVSAEGDELRVIVMPKAVEGQDAALSTPLSLIGTPAELDEKLPSILAGYVGTRQSLEDSLENVKTIMDEAKKTAQAKATKPAAKGSATKSVAVAASCDGEGDGDDFDDEDKPFAEAVVPTVTTSKNANKEEELNLFGYAVAFRQLWW